MQYNSPHQTQEKQKAAFICYTITLKSTQREQPLSRLLLTITNCFNVYVHLIDNTEKNLGKQGFLKGRIVQKNLK